MRNTDKKLKWILASGSPRRRELLENLGIELKIIKPEIDETEKPGERAPAYVRRLSREKALKGYLDWESTGGMGPIVLIAADTTVVTTDGKILGKPVNAAEAVRMLSALSGMEHVVYTAYTLITVRGKKKQIHSRVVRTRVRMRKLSRKQIVAYVKTGEPMDKAGAYAAQGIGALLVDSVTGSYFNVVGLPISQLFQDLEKMLGSDQWSFLKSKKITRK